MSVVELTKQAEISESVIRTLIKNSIVAEFEEDIRRDPLAQAEFPEIEDFKLTDAQAAAFTFGRHDARPEAEGIRWRSLPSFAAVVLPDESAIPFDEDRVDALPRPQFPARGGAAAGVRLNFVVRHAR